MSNFDLFNLHSEPPPLSWGDAFNIRKDVLVETSSDLLKATFVDLPLKILNGPDTTTKWVLRNFLFESHRWELRFTDFPPKWKRTCTCLEHKLPFSTKYPLLKTMVKGIICVVVSPFSSVLGLAYGTANGLSNLGRTVLKLPQKGLHFVCPSIVAKKMHQEQQNKRFSVQLYNLVLHIWNQMTAEK